MAGGTTPTKRILALAAYLDDHRDRRVTLGDITADVPGYDDGTAERTPSGELVEDTPTWESLRKKVRRDLGDLRTHWGIEVVYSDADRTYELRAPFFTPAERAAMIAAAAAVAVEGIGGRTAGELGASVDDAYAQVVVRVHDLVAELREYCASHTPVRFRHTGAERVLEPYALGRWHNRWYVAGWDPALDAMRRYRLDRIERPEGGDAITTAGAPGSYAIPEWFDAALAFDFDPNSWGRDPVLDARIRVDADMLDAFLRDLGGTVLEREDDHAIVGLTVRHAQWTRDRLLAFRGHAVPLAPPELVALVTDHLRAIAGSA